MGRNEPMKKLVILFIALVVIIYAQDARTRAYIHQALQDSAEVMRETIKDTADEIRSAIRDTTEATMTGDAIMDSLNNASRTMTNSWWMDTDSLFFTDGGADTNWIVNDGTYHRFGGDNVYAFGRQAEVAGNFFGGSDTLYRLGTANYRWYEGWIYYLMLSSPDDADTTKIYVAADTFWVESDNMIAFNNDLLVQDRVVAETLNATTCLETNKITTGAVQGTMDADEATQWQLPTTYIGVGDADSLVLVETSVTVDSLDVVFAEIDTVCSDIRFTQDCMVDSFFVPVAASVKNSITGYATLFVDTTGTDSLIIMVGATRRGVAIE